MVYNETEAAVFNWIKINEDDPSGDPVIDENAPEEIKETFSRMMKELQEYYEAGYL